MKRMGCDMKTVSRKEASGGDIHRLMQEIGKRARAAARVLARAETAAKDAALVAMAGEI